MQNSNPFTHQFPNHPPAPWPSPAWPAAATRSSAIAALADLETGRNWGRERVSETHSCPQVSWSVFLDGNEFADSPHSILGEDTTDDDTRWEEAFAASRPEIEQLAERVRAKIRSGQTRDMRIDDL